MLRIEFILVGCVLVGLGIGLCTIGYQKTQPTTVEQAASFFGELTGNRVPADVYADKTAGYFMLGGGVLCLSLGIGFMLKSRIPSSNILQTGSGDN